MNDVTVIQVVHSLSGSAPEQELERAYRAALIRLLGEIAAAGSNPFALERLRVRSADTALDPTEWRYDRLFREVLGGVRPRLEAAPGDPGKLLLEAELAPAKQAGDTESPVWRGKTVPELVRAYSARAAVPDHLDIFERWRLCGAAFLGARQVHRDLAFGGAPGERLDLFPPRYAGAPLHVFIHGGYWQAMDKEDHPQLLRQCLDKGWAVAVVNYTLSPEADVFEQVEEVRRALRYLWLHAEQYGYDRDRIQISGHSAGGHLGAWLLATDWRAWDSRLPSSPIHSALLVSGLFDLQPLRYLPFAPLIGIADPERAHAASPIHAKPDSRARVLLVVGGLESDEFHWQMNALAEAWHGRVSMLNTLVVPGTHHFSVLETFNQGELGDQALAMMEQ